MDPGKNPFAFLKSIHHFSTCFALQDNVTRDFLWQTKSQSPVYCQMIAFFLGVIRDIQVINKMILTVTIILASVCHFQVSFMAV